MSLLLDALKRAALEKRQRDGIIAGDVLQQKEAPPISEEYSQNEENNEGNENSQQQLSLLDEASEYYQPDYLLEQDSDSHISIELELFDNDKNTRSESTETDIALDNQDDWPEVGNRVSEKVPLQADNSSENLSEGEVLNTSSDLDSETFITVPDPSRSLDESLAQEERGFEQNDAIPLNRDGVLERKETIEKLILLRKEESRKEKLKAYSLYSLFFCGLIVVAFLYYVYQSKHFSGLDIEEENKQFLSSIDVAPILNSSSALNENNAKEEQLALSEKNDIEDSDDVFVSDSFSSHRSLFENQTLDEALNQSENEKKVTALVDLPHSAIVKNDINSVDSAVDQKNDFTTESLVANNVAVEKENLFDDSESYVVTAQSRPRVADDLILRAYQYYQQGKMSEAQSIYDDVLTQSPEHRNALLGAAAVATRRASYQEAFIYYQRLLNLYPQDVYAKAGLLSLASENIRNPQWLTQINQLLKQYPDVAHLHFLNANANAFQGDWATAQTSYFDAWIREKNNADYAYNLAISLDQLNQPNAALKYYHIAFNLSASSSHSVDKQALVKRIKQLEGRPNE